jgi:tetratricopeptide (TPR) repeat protein
LLGSLYIVKRDDQNAEKYLLQAAELDYPASLGVLGLFYENNKKDDKLAEVWYKKAVKAQWPQNYVLYGLFLEKQKNELEAEKYFLRAHKANDRWGTFQLGNLYYKQNKIEMAEKYLLEASNTGDSTAMYTYAELRRTTFNDLETACKWYTSASKLSGARAGSSPSLAKSALVSYCQSGLTGTPILANDVVMSEQSVRPYNSGDLTWIIPSENITADYNYVQFKQIKTDSLWKGISFANFAEPDGKKPWIQVTFNSPAKDLCFDFRLIKVEQSKVTKIWTLLPSNCYTYNNGIATRIER